MIRRPPRSALFPYTTPSRSGSGATGSEAENTAATNVVYTATASDPDTVGTVAFSLSGADAAQFSIDRASTPLRFRHSPNYDAASGSNGDNSYQIVVHANDRS